MTYRPPIRWAALLGFALGGFFDGILLHQILQWHHVLSLVPSVQSLRAQILWDGYFHALMYLVAAVSLWGLWRNRAGVQREPALRLCGASLGGFGLWHAVDAVLSHWVLGLHRIRVDAADPLVWDIGWLMIFGLVPLAVGWLLMRQGRPPSAHRDSGRLPVLLFAFVAVSLGAWSLQPREPQRFVTIVFAPGVRPAAVMNAIVASGGRLAWNDGDMGVVVVDLPPGRQLGFYGTGAVFVSSSILPLGCLSWSRA